MSNNKIEYIDKVIYWVTLNDGEFLSYGSTGENQITETIHEFKTYSTKLKWLKALEGFGVDEEDLELL